MLGVIFSGFASIFAVIMFCLLPKFTIVIFLMSVFILIFFGVHKPDYQNNQVKIKKRIDDLLNNKD